MIYVVTATSEDLQAERSLTTSFFAKKSWRGELNRGGKLSLLGRKNETPGCFGKAPGSLLFVRLVNVPS